MLFQLPNHATLYQALVAKDQGYDGRVYVCVSSTGIFCRIPCPARNPKPENCTFFETINECITAGFRPCKRCHPLGPAADHDPAIQTLLTALAKRPEYRWFEADIIRLGFDPSTIRRSFKRNFGITFLEMARAARLRDGVKTLSNGGKVIEAQLDAGFDSPSAFRSAFARLLGASPASFRDKALLRADYIDTPIGALIAVSDRSNLHLLEFADRRALPAELAKLRNFAKGELGFGRFAPTDQIEVELKAYFSGSLARFQTPLALHGTPFTKSVWRVLMEIPLGQTRAYSEIAQAIGNPAAVRAVARANGANQIAIVIPCHRVIGADGSLTGYGGGLWRKQKLIELEQNRKEIS